MTALDDLAPIPFHDADAPARSRMLSRLADTQLIVALAAEPAGDDIALRMFPLEGGQVALACDTEERLAGFFDAPTAYAGMPGRVLAGLLSRAGAGLLVNPGQPSEMLLDQAMLVWLQSALVAAPVEERASLKLRAPAAGTVAALAGPLAERLADLRGLISGAALVGVGGSGAGPDSHLLLIAGAPEDQQAAIAKALAESLAFLPPQPGGVDVSFAETPPPAGALRFDLAIDPAPAAPARPKGPPILR
ncbi:MAG: SseB family protein [Paracoccus sp. (in: a-proteobacteria)]